MDARIIAEIWVPIIGLVLGLPLLIVAALQIRQASTFKSADLINDLTSRFYDSGASGTFMTLIYNPMYTVKTDKIDETIGHGSNPQENSIRNDDFDLAKLLDFLNNVCYCIDRKMLDKKIVVNTVLGYAIAQTWHHRAIEPYLAWVDLPHEDLGRQKKAFHYFREYAPEILRVMYPEAPR